MLPVDVYEDEELKSEVKNVVTTMKKENFPK